MGQTLRFEQVAVLYKFRKVRYNQGRETFMAGLIFVCRVPSSIWGEGYSLIL